MMLEKRCGGIYQNQAPITTLAALAYMLGAAGACTSASDQMQRCTPGLQIPCICPDGHQGIAFCASDGTSQTECQCGEAIVGPGFNTQPIADSGAAQPPIGGSAISDQPQAGTGPEQQGTGGAEPVVVDTGIEDGLTIDAGLSVDSGPGPGTKDAASQPVDSAVADVQPNLDQDEVPATAHCAPVSDWDPAWSAWEEEVLVLTNEVRAKGADCGQYGVFGSADPLTMNPELRCSARLHSMDMAQRGFFEHTNPDGVDPFARMAAAGYTGRSGGENIAMGQTSPAQVVAGWVDSDGHCRNIMEPNYSLIGVGYYTQPSSGWFRGNWWTQNFGGSGWSWW